MRHEYDMDAIQSQAERWFARLRGRDCTRAERRDFNAWLASDAVHASAYARTQQLWSGLDELANDAEVVQWRREAQSAGANAARLKLRRLGLAVAASLALAVLVGGGFAWWRSSHTVVGSYVTARGERHSFSLADGSRLILNTNTVLDVRLDPSVRSVKLRQGEAIFDVAHESDRRFVVHAGGNTITDVGTRFDVYRDGARTEITVIEGAVNVERGGKTAKLTAGEQLVAGDKVWRKRHADLATATGWTHGKWIFRATPLSDVVAQVNRYGPSRLVIADSSLANLKISGQFRIGNTDALVRALQTIFPIDADRDPVNKTTRLYRKKSD